jgi:hypothetical protein
LQGKLVARPVVIYILWSKLPLVVDPMKLQFAIVAKIMNGFWRTPKDLSDLSDRKARGRYGMGNTV